jgi:hypothetical protein
MKTPPTQTEQPKKRNLKKAVAIGLGVVATSVAGFFGWKLWSDNKEKKAAEMAEFEEVQTPSSPDNSPKPSSSSSTTTVRRDEFPLKKGSRGERVKAMQAALIAKYGKTILPKYGADGDFGSEMVTALENKSLPTEINESLYNLYVKGASPDYSALAKKLYDAATSKNFSAAIEGLKQIRNTSDYSSVSEKFKLYRVDGGVRKTLVTGMLDTFKTTSQQDAVRMEFLRMGLKYDGSKWSLSGLAGASEQLLITTAPTELIDPKHKVKVQVPASMVIGYRIKEKNGLTLFRTIEKNKKLIVKSSTIKIYETN